MFCRSDLLQIKAETTGEGSGSIRETTGNDYRHNPSHNPKRINRYAGYHNTNNSNSSNTRNSFSSSDIISNTPPTKHNNNNSESGKSYSRSNSNSTNCSSNFGGGPSRTGSVSGKSSIKFPLGNVPPPKRPGNLETGKFRTPHNYNGESQNRRSLLSPDSGRPTSEVGFLEASSSNRNSFTSSSTATTSATRTFSEKSDSDKMNETARVRHPNDCDDNDDGIDIDVGANETGGAFNFHDDLEEGDSSKSLHSETELQASREIPGPLLTGCVRLPLSYPFRHVNNMTIIENKTYDLPDD